MSAGGFWSWSLARYEAEGVSSRLLALQDEFDLDVNILLWCGWCAERYGEIPEDVLKNAAALCESWSRGVTTPLRSARRALKTPPEEARGEDAAALRLAVKDAELAAEKIEQAMLEKLAGTSLAPAADVGNSLARFERNLVNYAMMAGAMHRAGEPAFAHEDLARRILAAPAGDDEDQPARKRT